MYPSSWWTKKKLWMYMNKFTSLPIYDPRQLLVHLFSRISQKCSNSWIFKGNVKWKTAQTHQLSKLIVDFQQTNSKIFWTHSCCYHKIMQIPVDLQSIRFHVNHPLNLFSIHFDQSWKAQTLSINFKGEQYFEWQQNVRD